MESSSRGRLRSLSVKVVALILILHAGMQVSTANQLLYDFEGAADGWENESAAPVVPQIVCDRARHGNCALAFTYTFSPTSRILHCRVKDGFPRDCSPSEFRGFSAWVFIPAPSKSWEARMFVRTGQNWTWQPGLSVKDLMPGWHRVQIRREEIDALQNIQDMGVHVILNSPETKTAQILIDQVEVITYP
jgi:hypothetical protein